MSERDCGKWYCQNAIGSMELIYGRDILIYDGPRAADNDRNALFDERLAITGNSKIEPFQFPILQLGGWMGQKREEGFDGWLAAYTHGNGAAQSYWVWDPHSLGRYLEAMGPYDPGTVPAFIGELHRGRGWQLPLVCVMTDFPTQADLKELQEVRVPFVVLPKDPPDVDPDDDDTAPDVADPPPPSDDPPSPPESDEEPGSTPGRKPTTREISFVRAVRRIMLLSEVHPTYNAAGIASDGRIQSQLRRLLGKS